MSLMGRVKEMASLANLKKVLCNEGFDNLKISYLGELWVLLEFESSKAKELFRKNAGAGSWFSVLPLAMTSVFRLEDSAWVEVGGCPFKLWTVKTFSRSASKWRRVLSPEAQEENNIFEESEEEKLVILEEFCVFGIQILFGEIVLPDQIILSLLEEEGVGFKSVLIFWLVTGVVYALKPLKEKPCVWEYWTNIQSWDGKIVMMGDFNEVRFKSDRFGSNFNVHEAEKFNSFIYNAGMEEVSLGGSAFTWCHRSASKMSKLDRFFVSENLLTSCPNISAITLERFISDHRPILLRETSFDYGPIPFRFYINTGWASGRICQMVRESWEADPGIKIMLFKRSQSQIRGFVMANGRVWIDDTDQGERRLFNAFSGSWEMVEDSRFWLDNKWSKGELLRGCFPRVYALELDKNISVSSKLKAPSLVTTFRRNTRSGIEHTQFDSMAEIMKTISLVLVLKGTYVAGE
ncbi:RNA-directed DNA polymerase, eukaryota [Tanacetum coccineum]